MIGIKSTVCWIWSSLGKLISKSSSRKKIEFVKKKNKIKLGEKLVKIEFLDKNLTFIIVCGSCKEIGFVKKKRKSEEKFWFYDFVL